MKSCINCQIADKGWQENRLHIAIQVTQKAWYRNESAHRGIFQIGNGDVKWKHFPRYWPFVWGIHRPVTWSFDVFFHLCLNKRLSKHSWSWWFEKPSRLLWRGCNGYREYANMYYVAHINSRKSESYGIFVTVYSKANWLKCILPAMVSTFIRPLNLTRAVVSALRSR